MRTMVELGGSYTDVVSAITQARQRGSLKARVAFDALPQQGRQYYLDEEEASDADTDEDPADEQLERLPAPEGLEDDAPTGVHDDVTL